MQRFVGLRCRGPCALTGDDARSLGQPAATGTVATSRCSIGVYELRPFGCLRVCYGVRGGTDHIEHERLTPTNDGTASQLGVRKAAPLRLLSLWEDRSPAT
jgi:hypothetical protein